jgi:ribosomal protein S4
VSSKFNQKFYKPYFKNIQKLKIHFFFNFKILKFRRKKWLNFLFFIKNSLNKKTKYKKFKLFDPTKILLNQKNFLELNFSKLFLKKVIESRIFNIYYCKLKKKYQTKLKKKLLKKLKCKKVYSLNSYLVELFYKRLDYILLVTKFFKTLRSSRNIIKLGFIKVNKKIIKSYSFLLKTGDIIKIRYFKLYNKYLSLSNKWPPLPKNLLVNYKSLEILYFSDLNDNKFNFNFKPLKNLIN